MFVSEVYSSTAGQRLSNSGVAVFEKLVSCRNNKQKLVRQPVATIYTEKQHIGHVFNTVGKDIKAFLKQTYWLLVDDDGRKYFKDNSGLLKQPNSFIAITPCSKNLSNENNGQGYINKTKVMINKSRPLGSIN